MDVAAYAMPLSTAKKSSKSRIIQLIYTEKGRAYGVVFPHIIFFRSYSL